MRAAGGDIRSVGPETLLTLDGLYALFDSLSPLRRRAVGAILERSRSEPRSLCRRLDSCADVEAALEAALGMLEALPGQGHERFLEVGGRQTSVTLDYEFEETARDLAFVRGGLPALRERLGTSAGFDEGVARVAALIAGGGYRAVFADRDGTLANYCGRYRSSHQSLYAAVMIGRFAMRQTGEFFMVTSGPLHGNGLLSLSAMPPGLVHHAGSKGREYVTAAAARGGLPVPHEAADALSRLDRALSGLLASPEYELFGVVGSGYQRKLGQVTVSRQDIHRSVPAELSAAFLERVREEVERIDPKSTRFEVYDTGFDVEVTLALSDGRGFTKGDGVRFLVGELGIDLAGLPVLVCGDTGSDLPMAEALVEAGALVDAVFVGVPGELASRARDVAARSAFCMSPDALVAALGGTEGGDCDEADGKR